MRKVLLITFFLLIAVFSEGCRKSNINSLSTPSCNPFGCSQSTAAECNPFGCPNPPMGGECTPFGCPVSPGYMPYPKITYKTGFIPADPIHFDGNFGYTISPKESSVNIYADKIVNLRGTGSTSGTLRLSLWATHKEYSENGLSGHIIATKKLGQLRGGFNLLDINHTVKYEAPSKKGTYYITLSIEEYDNRKWSIVYASTFDKKINL